MGFKLNKLPKAAGSGPAQPTLEPGTYPARVVQFIDRGIQAQRPFKGEDKLPVHEIELTYELLDVFMVDKDGNEEEDRPRWIREKFPVHRLEADLAKSTKRYKALDPNNDFDGDFSLVINQPCMLTVVLGENKKDPTRPYENIGNIAVMRAKEAAKAPELKNKSKVFLLEEPDMEVFKSFPEWLQTELKANLEFKGSKLEKALKGGPIDEDETEEENNEW